MNYRPLCTILKLLPATLMQIVILNPTWYLLVNPGTLSIAAVSWKKQRKIPVQNGNKTQDKWRFVNSVSVIAAVIRAVYFLGFLWEITLFGTDLGIRSSVPLAPQDDTIKWWMQFYCFVLTAPRLNAYYICFEYYLRIHFIV